MLWQQYGIPAEEFDLRDVIRAAALHNAEQQKVRRS